MCSMLVEKMVEVVLKEDAEVAVLFGERRHVYATQAVRHHLGMSACHCLSVCHCYTG